MQIKQRVNQIPASSLTAVSALIGPHIPELSDPVTILRLLRELEAQGFTYSRAPMSSKAPDLLSIKQAAKHMGCCSRSICNWIREGKLRAVRISRKAVRVPASELERLVSSSQEGRAVA